MLLSCAGIFKNFHCLENKVLILFHGTGRTLLTDCNWPFQIYLLYFHFPWLRIIFLLQWTKRPGILVYFCLHTTSQAVVSTPQIPSRLGIICSMKISQIFSVGIKLSSPFPSFLLSSLSLSYNVLDHCFSNYLLERRDFFFLITNSS